MLKEHVLPELESSEPFLRSRANWLYGEFSTFKYSDNRHVQDTMDGIYKSLFVEELPTKLAAAISLAQMLTNTTARTFIKPALGTILQVYLKLISEIDSEKLVSSLETIM